MFSGIRLTDGGKVFVYIYIYIHMDTETFVLDGAYPFLESISEK
jgi:hypothetical protein